jgi:glycosyltransferase involved in cell wall biosynthesis
VPAPDLAGPGPLIGAAGALVAHKGPRVLLEALAALPGLRCVIAGEGPLRGALTAQAAALGLGDRLKLLGQRENLPAVLAALDLLVHPSLEEGLGQVVVEAMAAGVPVLVSAAGGLPEVVGDTSVPVPVGDPGALARAIAPRLADPGDLGAARARARDMFSVDAMVEGTLAAYEEAASHLEPTP